MLYVLTRQRVRNHAQWFEAFAERGRVVELSGTHDLIISNPLEVLQEIDAFVSSLPKGPGRRNRRRRSRQNVTLIISSGADITTLVPNSPKGNRSRVTSRGAPFWRSYRRTVKEAVADAL